MEIEREKKENEKVTQVHAYVRTCGGVGLFGSFNRILVYVPSDVRYMHGILNID